MGVRNYDKATASVLLKLAFPYEGFMPYEVRDDGVYQSEDYRQASCEGEAFDWTPAYDMQWWIGAPNPLTAPMLPIPFTAADLAAFMLYGAGNLIPENLGIRIPASVGDVPAWKKPRRPCARSASSETTARN